MANASVKEAPLKESGQKDEWEKETAFLAQKFNPKKKYMFELAEENPVRELPVIDMITHRPAPHKKFKPFQNIVFTSQIIWKGERRILRYYDGCTSIFADEQPKDKDVIDQLIKQTKGRFFLDGKFGCFGDERMLLLYIFGCSWNAESEFRTRSANTIFVPSNQEKKATAEALKLDEQEKALKLAKEASETKMMIHAFYLGVPTEDYDSGNPLTPAQIRTEYRRAALSDATEFIKSYGNKALEMKYYISKAWETGLLTNKENKNKVVWKSSGKEVADISGLTSADAIIDRLLEISQLEEGTEFSIQLKALYKD